MIIVDSQVHIWAADSPERPWPQRPHRPHRPVPFSKDDLLAEMDAAGVQRAVIVPPTWDGERNDLALVAARLHPDRLAVMGRLVPDAADAAEHLARWRDQTGMLGLRFSFGRVRAYADALAEGRLDWIWQVAEQAGLPVMIFVFPPQLPLVERIAAKFPRLKVVLDHMALETGKKDEEAFGEFDKLLALATRPNVAVKASSMPSYTTDAYPYRRIHGYLRRAYDAFGPKRIFWGSDLTKLQCSYRQTVTMFTEEMPWLSEADKEWIMGRALCEWLGWRLP